MPERDITAPIDPFSGAAELAAALRARRITSRELLECYLDRLRRFNPLLNAVIDGDIEQARREADAADAAASRGQWLGSLHGLPMTVKESVDVAGLRTTWGSPDFADNRPARDAVCVARLRAAGAIVFGKTNLPLFLGDLQTFNALYGSTHNPWDLSRTPGGSSGGSAAALAAGLTALEIGSDIASSIRTPAHYCGVYGHKPTFGLVSTVGQRIANRLAPTDLAAVGPMARRAEDLALALKLMAGPDEVDGQAWRVSLPEPVRRQWRDLRIAVMLEVPHAPVDDAVQEGVREVARLAQANGARVDHHARPDIDTECADALYRRLLESALSGRGPADEFEAAARAARALDPEDRSPRARQLRDRTLSHRDWMAADELRHRMRAAWREFFDRYDLLLCPPAASLAPPHHQRGDPFERPIHVHGALQPLSCQFFWAGYASLAHLPATVAPAGLSSGGLPRGVQIIGPAYGDLACIRFAELLAEAGMGFIVPPAFRIPHPEPSP